MRLDLHVRNAFARAHRADGELSFERMAKRKIMPAGDIVCQPYLSSAKQIKSRQGQAVRPGKLHVVSCAMRVLAGRNMRCCRQRDVGWDEHGHEVYRTHTDGWATGGSAQALEERRERRERREERYELRAQGLGLRA